MDSFFVLVKRISEANNLYYCYHKDKNDLASNIECKRIFDDKAKECPEDRWVVFEYENKKYKVCIRK